MLLFVTRQKSITNFFTRQYFVSSSGEGGDGGGGKEKASFQRNTIGKCFYPSSTLRRDTTSQYIASFSILLLSVNANKMRVAQIEAKEKVQTQIYTCSS